MGNRRFGEIKDKENGCVFYCFTTFYVFIPKFTRKRGGWEKRRWRHLTSVIAERLH